MMRFNLRKAGAIALLALLIVPTVVLGQDSPVTVVGSGVVAPVFEALAATTDTEIDVQVTGTSAGLQALCSGEAQVALATRAISVTEEAGCAAAGVEFIEVLAGHNVVAFVTSPESELPQCVTTSDLNAALAPSAQGQAANWSQVNSAFPDVPVVVSGPAVDTAAYALVDSVIEGVGLRNDLQTIGDLADAVAEPGGLAVVSLNEALAAGDAVRILEVNMQTGTGCAAPSAENVEDRSYPAAENLYVYVATDAAQDAAVIAILSALTTEEGAALVEEAGFTPATASAYAQGQDALTNGTTGRQFSLYVTDFVVPEQLSGSITLVGSPTLVQYFRDLTSNFTAQYPAVTADTAFVGSTSGLNRLCADTADIAVIDSAISDAAAEACAASGIETATIGLGSEAVMLLASADAEYLSCLTTEQIVATWRANAETPATSWDQVSSEFEAAPVYLFAPSEGTSSAGDLMMIKAAGSALPTRSDVTERNNDPLYRAAAVANAGSGLTIMTWPEYQLVLERGQTGVQLVSVDAGEGCVEPSVATIADGSYALARPVQLVVNQVALARPEVQALLWTILADENYGRLQAADLVGIAFGDLPAQRAALQAQFDAAEALVAAQPPATDEADVEATEDADAEATEEAAEDAE